jgi:nitrite reductase/ring-hydroxylating ferredoxin subunit
MFLHNAWYVAAWEREVGDTPYATTILGDHVAIYRGASGTYGALADACPHRKVPLSMGRVQGDDIECGYHGLIFDCAGVCVKAPGNERPPLTLRESIDTPVRSVAVSPCSRVPWVQRRASATLKGIVIDHSARDNGLAKTDFVSQEEAPRAAAVR